MEKLISSVLGGLLVILLTVALYLAFVMLPVALHAEAKCLRAGYPKATVTIGLEQYCLTLDGVVTVTIDHL